MRDAWRPDLRRSRQQTKRNHYDRLVEYGPASAPGLNRVILLRSDIANLPCGYSDLDATGTRQELQIIHDLQEIRDGTSKAWFVPNRMHPEQVKLWLLALAGSESILFVKRHIRHRYPYTDEADRGAWFGAWGARASRDRGDHRTVRGEARA